MSEQSQGRYQREVRDTVVKSGLTGAAATALAVAIFSPAGLGGMIGTSVASGQGADPGASDVYARLPAFPAPLTAIEIDEIQSQLARTAASLEITRAATSASIERVHEIAATENLLSVGPLPPIVAPALPRIERVEAAPQPGPAVAALSSGGAVLAPEHDAHLELAELMFAHENL